MMLMKEGSNYRNTNDNDSGGGGIGDSSCQVSIWCDDND